MLETLMWMVGTPAWAVGGAYSAKSAIAIAERHYLELSRQAWEKDRTLIPQEQMDADDWIGAGMFAALAFVAAPVIGAAWLGNKLFTPFKKPTKKFFEPPMQKSWREHVEALNTQKQLVMSTARTYQEILEWEPEDHPDRLKFKQQLEDDIKEQMSTLMKMANPDRAWDGNYLDEARQEIKQLTRGK